MSEEDIGVAEVFEECGYQVKPESLGKKYFINWYKNGWTFNEVGWGEFYLTQEERPHSIHVKKILKSEYRAALDRLDSPDLAAQSSMLKLQMKWKCRMEVD